MFSLLGSEIQNKKW